jgi:hypothetical protein
VGTCLPAANAAPGLFIAQLFIRETIETLFTMFRNARETSVCQCRVIESFCKRTPNRSGGSAVDETTWSAARSSKALTGIKDETMTFALGLFAALISAMFIATFASSVIASSREAQTDAEFRRLRIF